MFAIAEFYSLNILGEYFRLLIKTAPQKIDSTGTETYCCY